MTAVPNARVARAVAVADADRDGGACATAGTSSRPDWREAGVDPEDLWALARRRSAVAST